MAKDKEEKVWRCECGAEMKKKPKDGLCIECGRETVFEEPAVVTK